MTSFAHVKDHWIDLLYAITAIAVAAAILLNAPRPTSVDNRFPACFTNICFA